MFHAQKILKSSNSGLMLTLKKNNNITLWEEECHQTL